MEDLHRSADKVAKDARLLQQALGDDQVDVALSTAKRVRRDSTILVRALARIRDATAQEGTSR